MDEPNRRWPTRRGFERFFGTLEGAGSFYQPAHADAAARRTSSTRPREPDFFYTDAISDEAVGVRRAARARAGRRPVLPLPRLHRAALAAARATRRTSSGTTAGTTPAGTSCASSRLERLRRGGHPRRDRRARRTATRRMPAWESTPRPGVGGAPDGRRTRRRSTGWTRASAGPRRARGGRPARQHARRLPLRQRRLRRGDAARLGRGVRDRVRAAQGGHPRGRAGRPRQRTRRSTPARRTRTRATAARWAQPVEHAVPRVQALGPRGRHRDPADRPLAGRADRPPAPLVRDAVPAHRRRCRPCSRPPARSSRASATGARCRPPRGVSMLPALRGRTVPDARPVLGARGQRGGALGAAGSWSASTARAGSSTTSRPTAPSGTTVQPSTRTWSRT